MLYFYSLHSFPQLINIFVCIHVLIDVLSLVAHKPIAGYTVHAGII